MANFYANYPIQGSSGGGGAITDLTGDVSATGPGSAAATVNAVGGSTAANVNAATVLANAATSANTASAIVKRDVSGDFTAGTITASLTGTASGNPPNSRTISTTAPLTGGGDLSADRTFTITQSGAASNGYLSSTDWNTFNGKQASGNYITALTGGVTASGPGSASATVVTNANLTGVITSVGNATSIAAQTGTGSTFVVQTSPTLTTPDLGTPSACVGTNITGTATGFTSGITQALKSATTTVDVSASTAPTTGQVLTATGGSAATWQNPATSGTVTSVAMSVPSVLSVSGSPVTGAGTLAVSYSGTALPVANGGTGLTAGTSGGILGYTASGTIASSAALTANQLIIGGGAGVTPSTLAAGTQYQSLTMGATTPGYSAVNLAQAAAVTGVLPNANTTATTANTASAIAARDANGNIKLTNAIQGYTSTTTAAGTTTLTAASTYNQTFVGGTTQTVVLPDATTLSVGWAFEINNESSGTLTVNTNGGSLLTTVYSFGVTIVTCMSIGTAAGTWDIMYFGVPFTLLGDLVYGGTLSGAPTRLLGNTTSTKKWLNQTGNGSVSAAPTWTAIAASDIGSGTLTQARGGTGISSPSVLYSASNYAYWDSVGQLTAARFVNGISIVATAAGTTTATNASFYHYRFTGSSTQTFKLPVVSTLLQTGDMFLVTNVSTGVVTVQSSGANTIVAMAANTSAIFTNILTTGTGTASWQYQYLPFTWSPGQYVGTSTNDSATAGNIGELVTSTISTAANAAATTNLLALTSITLSAGDWDISAFSVILKNGATFTDSAQMAVSTTSASTAGTTSGLSETQFEPPTIGTQATCDFPRIPASLAGSTTYYLNVGATYSAGTPKWRGTISARRVR